MKILYISDLNNCPLCSSTENIPHRVFVSEGATSASDKDNVMCSNGLCRNTGVLSITDDVLSVIWDSDARILDVKAIKGKPVLYEFEYECSNV